MSVHDLDALASEPLTVKHSGKEYVVDVTVETMMEIDKARQEGNEADQWVLIETIMEKADMPKDLFRKLNVRQATSLAEAITTHFFPEAVAEAARAASQSNGQSPSSDSSATSEETPPE